MKFFLNGPRVLVPAVLAIFTCFFTTNSSAASTVAVGTCLTGLVHFTTIQAAIDASPAGITIKVCPGTYQEQVSINKKLTLEGVASGSSDAAIIVPPAGGLVQNTTDIDNPTLGVAAQILVVSPAITVNISNLTVDGLNNLIAGCGPDLQGILFQNASGTLNHVAVRNQTLSAGLGGCQSGEGIFVQTAAGLTSTVTVENSSVHSYNKNGITGNDTGTSLTVTGTYVQGAGVVPFPGAAQNGIQIGFGATGKVTTSTVIDNIYGDTTQADSADILLFDTEENSGISIATNVVGNSQLPIVMFTFGGSNLGDGVSVTGNKIFGTASLDAIDACTNGNTIKNNTIFNSSESGIHLDASCGPVFGGSTGNTNVVTGNSIVESGCAGILADSGTSGNTTTPNTYFTVPTTVASSCPAPASARSRGAHKFQPAR
jgi:parallel beta-helix repeat protein